MLHNGIHVCENKGLQAFSTEVQKAFPRPLVFALPSDGTLFA